jgi:adenylate kinase family enzyme
MKEKIESIEKQPKLILLTGPPGIGKSTLSSRYANDNPMTLNIDVDHVWWMMGQWQQTRPESDIQKLKLSALMAEAHLEDKHDVVMAQDRFSAEYYQTLESIARKTGSILLEVTLICPEDEAVQRCIDRGKRSGYETGFRPGGILETEGGVEKLKSMYREMYSSVSGRDNMNFIQSEYNNQNDTYRSLLAIVNKSA